MARQQVVVALLLLATVGLVFAADAASPAAATKPDLLTFAGVPSAGPVPDNNDVGTIAVGGSGNGASEAPSPGGAIGGSGAGASDAPSPGGADSVTAGSVGGPVSDSAFGSIASGNAEGPNASAATVGYLSARVVVAAGIAASFLF